MCAQLQLAIDCFFALGDALKVSKKSALLLTCENETMKSEEGENAIVTRMCNYLGWKIKDIITVLACINRKAIGKTDYPQNAYELGK